jgi:hypothetical protein
MRLFDADSHFFYSRIFQAKARQVACQGFYR